LCFSSQGCKEQFQKQIKVRGAVSKEIIEEHYEIGVLHIFKLDEII